MKFKKSLFVCTAGLICFGFFNTSPANALSKTCSSGTFAYLSTQCLDCPEYCYCPGGQNQTGTGYVWGTISNYCAKRGNISDKAIRNAIPQLGSVFICPQDYPLSKSKSATAADCFKSCYGNGSSADLAKELAKAVSEAVKQGKTFDEKDLNIIYNEQYSCKAGYYLPANATSDANCTKCPKDGKSYCPGVPARTLQCNDSNTYGLEECGPDHVPDENSFDCVVKCSGNKVLNNAKNGCNKCTTGTVPNADHTECVKDEKSVPAGKYLPKGANTPTDCKQSITQGDSNNKKTIFYYCPGGNYVPSDTEEQGLFTCPTGERTNKDRTACLRSINKTEMETCWLYVDNPEKFQECVLD